MKKYICAIIVFGTIAITGTTINASQTAHAPYSLTQYQQKKVSLPLSTTKQASHITVPATPSTGTQKALSTLPIPRIPSGKPIVNSILSVMSATKKYMSPMQWWSIMTNFVGSLFLRFWSNVWDIVRDGLANVVGIEKIYELNSDGSIKTNKYGTKMPRLITQFSLNDEGESVKEMIPTKWYKVLEDRNSLLGLIVTSGIDGSVEATFKSLDRLFFRPLTSKVLQIPLWKLSHLHYQLAMTELQYPGVPVINPKALATNILKNKNPGLFMTNMFPFSLRSIMAAKEHQEKMLITAITQHLWTIYQPIWQELEQHIKVSRRNDEAAQGDSAKFGSDLATQAQTEYKGKKLNKAQVFGDKLVDEASTIALESMRAKVFDGPLAQYMAYATLALRIPEAIFGAQFNTQPATQLVGNDGQPLNDELTNKLMIAIDICDALAAKARSRNLEIADDKQLNEMIWVTHASGERNLYKVNIGQDLVTKLLERQEQGLREYLPFCSHFAGEPYDRYIVKLLMPRLIIKGIPASIREELGIYNYADATASIELIKNKFNITFKSLTAISSLMAMIKKFEGTKTFAGRYVEIGDTFDRCLQDLSSLVQSVYPTPKDPWQKRLVDMTRRSVLGQVSKHDRLPPLTWTEHITNFVFAKQAPAFSVTQKSRLQVAAQKSGYTNPILAFNKKDILNYINNTQNTIQFNSNKTTIREIVERQSKAAISDKPDISLLSYSDLIDILNDWYNGNPSSHKLITIDRNNQELRSQVIERAYKIVIYTFGLLSLNQANKVDAFFTAEQNTTPKTNAAIQKDYEKFEAKMNNNLILVVSNIQEFVSVFHNFYMTFGLREIIAALDEHYRVTGQKGKDIPLNIFAKIAVREGASHIVGYGAEKLLKGLLNTYVLPRINALQSSGLIGGNVVNQMLNKHLDVVLGTVNGRTSAYHASRELIKNIFDYGAKTALKPENILATAGSKVIPAQFSGKSQGANEYSALMAHAKMAAESGKAPSPLIAQRLKKIGIDPENLPKPAKEITDDFDNEHEFDEEAFVKALKRNKQ
jgi:hypothetical protein